MVRRRGPDHAVDNPDVRFAVPDSGGMLWSDNFMIPNTTDKANLATDFINFFYDPKNAAVLTAGIQYISPVEGVADELTKMGGTRRRSSTTRSWFRPTSSSRPWRSSVRWTRPRRCKFDQRFSQILGSG